MINVKKYFNMLLGRKFDTSEFIKTFLPLLQESGVGEFNLDELSKKLYYYYKTSQFKEIFEELSINDYEEKLNITEVVEQEKNLAQNLWYEDSKPEKIYLNYPSYMPLNVWKSNLSRDGLNKLTKIACDFSTRYKIEITSISPLNIYSLNPNKKFYYLGSGISNRKEIRWDLITDGDIKNIKIQNNNGNFFFENPEEIENKLLLKNNTIKALYLKNAKYAIIQGFINNEIKKIKVYTELLDKYTLEQIKNLGNTIYKTDENLIDEGKPYVRKIKI